MRFQIFFSGALMLAFGAYAMQILDRNEALAFLQGTLTLGGGIIICGLFSLKMKWHGIIAAGVMALLGAARGLGNLTDLATFFTGENPRGSAPMMEFGITVLCLGLLLKVVVALQKERTRRMLEQE